MQTPTRQEIFAQAAKKLRQDFDELGVIPHAVTKGTEGESLVRAFLNSHLPGRFRAGSGFVLDRNDQVSTQTDVVVYDALNCPVYRASDVAGIYPNDNVAAVVEVKSVIDKEKLVDAAEKIARAKSLAKTKRANSPGLINIYTFGCVFAFTSNVALDTLEEHCAETIRTHGLGRHIDALMVLDKGLITLAGRPRGGHWSTMMYDSDPVVGPALEGAHVGTGLVEYGVDTLDAFLRVLLTHVSFFRSTVDHPGFQIGPGRQMIQIRYLTSLTTEKDPVKKGQKLQKYKEDARRSLEGGPEKR